MKNLKNINLDISERYIFNTCSYY